MSTPINVSYRLAEESDAPTMAALNNAAYAADKTTQFWRGEERGPLISEQDVLEKKIRPATTNVIVATDGTGEIIGICCVTLLDDSRQYPRLEDRAPGTNVWIDSLAVLPSLHGIGLGGKLLRYVEDFAVKELDARRFLMDTVGTRVETIAWYKKRGYSLTGERKPFIHDDDAARRTMWDGLEFVVLGKDAVVES